MFRIRSDSGIHLVVGVYSHLHARWFLCCSGGCDWKAEVEAPATDDEPARQAAEGHIAPIDEAGKRDLRQAVLAARNAQARHDGKPELQTLF